MFMSKSLKVDGIHVSSWGEAQWTCMQHVWEHRGCWRLFEKMPSGDVVTCNVVGLGHVKCGQG